MVNTTNMMKSTSIQTSADFNKVSKNYSIIDNRSTSPIGFFTKTKISKSFYLTKSELMNEEETS